MKNKIFAYIASFLFCLLVWALAVTTCHGQPSHNVRDCVAATFTSQLGIHELTGHNDGPQVETYLKSVRLKAGAPWCAAFVNWCLVQCGAPHAGSGWSPDWFPPGRIIWNQRGLLDSSGTLPRKGDVLGVYFEGKRRIAHVGFIEEWRGRSEVSIEGNTNAAGSREGTLVDRKIRLTAQLTVANWIDP